MIKAIDLDVVRRLKSGMRIAAAANVSRHRGRTRRGVRARGNEGNRFDVPHSISPAFGYRIDTNGRSIVLSGDTRYSGNAHSESQGVDVLVHEVVFGPQPLSSN